MFTSSHVKDTTKVHCKYLLTAARHQKRTKQLVDEGQVATTWWWGGERRSSQKKTLGERPTSVCCLRYLSAFPSFNLFSTGGQNITSTPYPGFTDGRIGEMTMMQYVHH